MSITPSTEEFDALSEAETTSTDTRLVPSRYGAASRNEALAPSAAGCIGASAIQVLETGIDTTFKACRNTSNAVEYTQKVVTQILQEATLSYRDERTLRSHEDVLNSWFSGHGRSDGKSNIDFFDRAWDVFIKGILKDILVALYTSMCFRLFPAQSTSMLPELTHYNSERELLGA